MSIVYVQKSCISDNYFPKHEKNGRNVNSLPLKLFQHKSKSEPFARYKYLVRIILTWCGRQELNLHGVTTRSLVLRVCQFRHDRIGTELLYNTPALLSTYFCPLSELFSNFPLSAPSRPSLPPGFRRIFLPQPHLLFRIYTFLRIFFLIHTHNMCKWRKFL